MNTFKQRYSELFPSSGEGDVPLAPLLERLNEMEELLNGLACEMTKYDLRRCEELLKPVRRRGKGGESQGLLSPLSETTMDGAGDGDDDALWGALLASSSASSTTAKPPSLDSQPNENCSTTSNDSSTTASKTTDSAKTIVYKDLLGAKIVVEETCGDLRLLNLTDCLVDVVHPVRGASHISNCFNCKFRFRTHQFRAKEAVNCDLLLAVSTSAVVERCKGLR